MLTFSAGDAAAINAYGRAVAYFTTFGDVTGGPVVVDSWTTNSQIKDLPVEVSLLTGVSAAQATMTIAPTSSVPLSPFVNADPSASEGSRVTLQVQVGAAGPVTSGIFPSATLYPGTGVFPDSGGGVSVFTVFTGVVTSVKFGVSGEATITALDDSAPLQGTFDCGAGTVPGAYSAPGVPYDNAYSPLVVIDAALRAGGVYLTPTPQITDPILRGKYMALSVPNVGGMLPDVGSVQRNLGQYGRLPGKFTPDCWAGAAVDFYPAVDITTAGPWWYIQMDCWVTVPVGVVSGSLASWGSTSLNGTNNGVNLLFNATQITGQVIDDNGFTVNAVMTGTIADGNPHYVRVTLHNTSAATDVTVEMDTNGAVTTFPYDATRRGSFTNAVNGARTYGGNNIVIEDLEIVAVPQGGPNIVASRRSFTPPMQSAITATPARLSAVAAHQGLSEWGTIQEVAKAEGAIAWFAQGAFHFEPRSYWLGRRSAAPVAAYTLSNMASLTVTFDKTGLHGSVAAAYAPWSTTPSTVATPCYSATSTIVLGRGREVHQIVTTERMQNLFPLAATLRPTNGALDGRSHFQAVPAFAEGDPAAQLLTNVQLSVIPTLAGFTLISVNPNAFPVALWSPGNGTTVQPGPYLYLDGTRVVQSQPITITQVANPKRTDQLLLPANDWRQSKDATQLMVSGTAGDVTRVVPVFDRITVPGDPRIQLMDPVTVQGGPEMPTPVRALVVSIDHHADPGQPYTTDLTLRAVAPTQGWVLGMPGRSEMGLTSTFPAL